MTWHKQIDIKKLEEKYSKEKLPIWKIAQYFSVSLYVITSRLIKFNIPKRKHINKPRKIKDGKRYCALCKNMVDLDKYSKNKGSPTGYGSRCLSCLRVESKKWYKKEENKEKVKKQSKKYYIKNKEKINAYNKKYCYENREKIIAQKKIYNKTDAKKESDKRYKEKNKELVAERLRNYLIKIRKDKPWMLVYWGMRKRCLDPKRKDHKSYYDKGIQPLLNKEELKKMWLNFKAGLMLKPELHRLNADEDYTVENCIFVPQKYHAKLEKLNVNEQKEMINKIIEKL